MKRAGWATAALALILGGAPVIATESPSSSPTPATRYADTTGGADWPGYGRGFSEQHYSPLAEIDRSTVARLGLVSHFDLDQINSATQPIAVDGIVYFGAGFSIVHAVDARSGRLLWRFDPQGVAASGSGLRLGWGSRGIAWWNGKIYTGTHDGRLIALDARTGRQLWSVQTFEPGLPWYISGAPRIADGKVVIGFGSDLGKVRGYVTAYDAETGDQAWRFYTVPGNPAVDRDETTRLAASTWAGEWWRFGGGGTVWNAMSYDPDLGLLYLGTGNGWPWNHKVRSAGRGDNLFLSSIVAVDARSGAYRWHYQVDPGETWDYNAAMDMALADLDIGGSRRKVLMTAPKNGFFYVIDRSSGKLISAKPYERVSWGSHIDLNSGRPIRYPEASFPDGQTFELWPSSSGAHSWPPMAFSPQTRLVYIPAIHFGLTISDAPDIANWRPPTAPYPGATIVHGLIEGEVPSGSLVAWDPITQRQAWRVPYPTPANGGVLATAGGLVFQGSVDGQFRAFDAKDGKLLWSFDAGAPILAPPIAYRAGKRQYVSLLTGMGTTLGVWGPQIERHGVDPRSQQRRLLTFALDGRLRLPRSAAAPAPLPDDPDFRRDASLAGTGAALYARHCILCHGAAAVSATHAPDLRRSGATYSPETFAAIVRDGVLRPAGMPAFSELGPAELEALRHYVRSVAQDARIRKNVGSAEPAGQDQGAYSTGRQ